MKNQVCLADGYVFSTDQNETGINENRLIVGTTRCGKTFSIVEPMLLHTYEGSLVVTITKRELFHKYSKLFKERGYEVLDLNFSEPEKSDIAYDPLRYLSNERDYINIGRALSECLAGGKADPYWAESTAACITAMFRLIGLNAETDCREPSFADFSILFRNLQFFMKDSVTNIDYMFDEAEKLCQDSMALKKWNTIRVNSPRTTACLSSALNIVLDDILDSDLGKMMNKPKKISFVELGSKKTILFVTTSPFNKASEKITNIFYYDLFKNLFEYAERCPKMKLPIPVHIICDDFATGGRVPDFAEYISLFCAKGISTTLLLQSESQLTGLYSDAEAKTIINNCDTYVYMGGMDDNTCHSISKRLNKPVDDIYYMPLEQVIVMRRGSKPIIGRRYQTLSDPLYNKLISDT